MKCQKCDKIAIIHITEMIDATPRELHLCLEHANEYLHGGKGLDDVDVASLQDTADELVNDDFQLCPYCAHSFQDFRKTGKLGCGGDYRIFFERLEPLIFGIHGALEHGGKRPKRLGEVAKIGPSIVRLRYDLQDAVEVEDYERAAMLRDRITTLEEDVERQKAAAQCE